MVIILKLDNKLVRARTGHLDLKNRKRYCGMCKEFLTYDFFYLIKSPYEYHYFNPVCKYCNSERCREYQLDKRPRAKTRKFKRIDGLIYLQCTICKIYKNDIDFYPRKHTFHERSSSCKDCHNKNRKRFKVKVHLVEPKKKIKRSLGRAANVFK